MAFMAKVKQILGIGGVKVKLTANPQVSKAATSIDGSIELNSKSDQLVTKLIVQLVEHRTTGKGEDKKHQKFDLGEVLVTKDLDVKADQPARFDFNLPFRLQQTLTDKMQNKGGVLGVMGKLGSLAEHERVEYKLVVSASVKGRMMAASHGIDVKMVSRSTYTDKFTVHGKLADGATGPDNLLISIKSRDEMLAEHSSRAGTLMIVGWVGSVAGLLLAILGMKMKFFSNA